MIKIAYVKIPKDLSKVKDKVFLNMTKRQLLCLGCGALVSVPLFFILRGRIGNSTAGMIMVLTMMPFFLFAMYEKNGEPPEKFLGDFIRVNFIRPKRRMYRTENFYDAVMRQNALDKEVYMIVHGKKADESGKEADRRSHRQSKADR